MKLNINVQRDNVIEEKWRNTRTLKREIGRLCRLKLKKVEPVVIEALESVTKQ